MLDNGPAKILQRPGIGLHGPLRIGVAAEPVMHTAETFIPGKRHGVLHLLYVEKIDRVTQTMVPFGHETILLPLALGHGNDDAFAAMFGRIAEKFVHLRPQPVLFIKQRALVMRGTAAVATRCFPSDNAFIEHSHFHARPCEPPACAEPGHAATDDDNVCAVHSYIPV